MEYESPIERIFGETCPKYLDNDNMRFDRQVEVNTQHGQVRLDFLLSRGTDKIAVECDGRDFHNAARDEMRDAILLGEGHITTIYHFRGCDLWHYTEDCLWVISREDPSLFTPRGRLHLARLHKLDLIPPTTSESYTLWHPAGPDHGWVWIFRRNNNQQRKFWRNLYELACLHPTASLDDLANKAKQRNFWRNQEEE